MMEKPKKAGLFLLYVIAVVLVTRMYCIVEHKINSGAIVDINKLDSITETEKPE